MGSPPSSPRRVTREHRGGPRHVSFGSCSAIVISPFSSGSSTRLGRGTRAGSTPAAYSASSPTVQKRRRCARRVQTGAGQTPGPFFVPRHSLFRRAAAAGRQRVFSWVASSRVVKSHWEAWAWSAIVGAQGTGACSRLSPPVPGPHGDRGHTCRTPPWACSVSSQSDASRKRVWQEPAELAVPIWAWRADTHARKVSDEHGHNGSLWCTSSVHRSGAQRTRWRLRPRNTQDRP